MAHTTINIQSRVEICSIASLTRAYIKEGHTLRSKSDIIWRAIEQLSLMYERKHEEDRFSDPVEAIDYMERVGLSLGTNARTMKALQQAQADHSYFAETGEVFSGFRTTKGKMVGGGAGPDMAALREMAEENARRIGWEAPASGGQDTPIADIPVEQRASLREERDKDFLQQQRDLIASMAKKKGEGE